MEDNNLEEIDKNSEFATFAIIGTISAAIWIAVFFGLFNLFWGILWV